MGLFSGTGLTPGLKGVVTNVVALAPGQVQIINPAGWYYIELDKSHTLQQFDPITLTWRGVGSCGTGSEAQYFYSDGVSYRIANQTGSPVGALLTNAGSGYTAAPVFTPSTGNSVWKAILGGAVSTTVVVASGGANYTYPPIVQISAPPAGGIQATGYATISSGAVSGVTIVDQGAGYTYPPTITFVNDPREMNPATALTSGGINIPPITQGYGAAAVTALTGAGTVTGVLLLDHGVIPSGGLTSLPTLSVSSGSAAATVLMNWTITGFAFSTAGVGLSGAFAPVTAEDVFPVTAAAYTNPTTQANLVTRRRADAKFAVSAGALSGSAIIYDGGCFTAAPTPLVWANSSVVTTAPVVTATVGGAAGTSYLTQL